MKRVFNIQMSVPLGRREGTLSFVKNSEEDIAGVLSLFQNETPFTGTLTPDGAIAFSGRMITLTRTFLYQAQGKVNGAKIKLEVAGEGERFTISGQEVTL